MELAPAYHNFVEKTNFCGKLILQVRDKLKTQLRYQNARMKKLQKAFIEEVEEYEYELVSSRLKADRKLGAQFKFFNKEYAFELLSMYLWRCV